MNRDNNFGKKKPAIGSSGNYRKNGSTSHYHPQKERRSITEDERLRLILAKMLVANCQTKRDFELLTPEFKLDFCIRHQYRKK